MPEKEMRIMLFSISRKAIDTYLLIWILFLGWDSIILNRICMKGLVISFRGLFKFNRRILNGNCLWLVVIGELAIMKRVLNCTKTFINRTQKMKNALSF